ncbi:MAG: hypothetical protein FWB86_00760 [Treponema sp.]|nr:hypothetical protein [Treponema sp.]MCL2250626.1 hypothetical protein [Treponema sp.]
MKKIAILFFIICMAWTTATAQEDGIGLSVGAEVIILDLEEAGDFTFIRPFIIYEKSFNNIDFYTGFGLNIPTDYSFYGVGLDLDIGGTYNLSISDESVLTFSLGALIYLALDSYRTEEYNGMYSENTIYGFVDLNPLLRYINVHLNLGVQFTQTLSVGDLYFGINVPFNLVGPNSFFTVFDIAELQITAGMDMEMGLGFGLTFYGWIGKAQVLGIDSDFAQLLEIFASYTTGPLFLGLTFGLPVYKDGIKNDGFSITPEVECSFDFGLSLFAKLPIGGIGSDDDLTSIGLTIGAKYSF